MSKDLKNSITEILLESSHFNVNDVLVTISKENKKLFFTDDTLVFKREEFPKRILSESIKYKKETGVNVLTRSVGIVEFDYEGNSVRTPILLHPITFSINKIKDEITFVEEDEVYFINPFLAKFISQSSNQEIPDEILMEPNLNSVIEFLKSCGFEKFETEEKVIGNFHHHRYQIIKELEELSFLNSFNPNLSSLFGFEKNTIDSNLDLPPTNLLPADIDHERVFTELESNNLVVQGPPGTGKSQVLTNVLARLLKSEKTCIVVSEKRVALEVLVKKLSEFGLDKLCFIATSDQLSHSFLQELKSTWDYFEVFEKEKISNLGLSKQYEDNLQMTLDLLSQSELIGDVSFHQFKELSSGINFENAVYISQVPSIQIYLENEEIIKEIYTQKLNHLIGYIKPEILKNESFVSLDSKIREWNEALNRVSKAFDFTSWSELRSTMKIAAECQVYENDFYKKYSSIFKVNSRANKRFLSLRKKYLKSKKEIDLINNNQSHWKVVPSEIETRNLLETFSNGGFFQKRKARKRWNEIATVSQSKAIETLQIHLTEIEEINTYSHIIIDFCELGIENPENEISPIHQTLTQFSKEQWFELENISSEKRALMTSFHHEINFIYSDLRAHFNFEDETNISLFLPELSKAFDELIPVRKKLKSPNQSLLKLLIQNETFSVLKSTLYKSHWVQFKERFPMLAEFDVQSLIYKIEDVINSQNKEAIIFSKEIETQIDNRFKEYHDLLNTPARKLNENQKKLKIQLRKGKALLIKEFGKTRSHPSLRELYNSEARIWIQLLKPIWLSNPTQLAKCFPLEENLFDLAIFDEATQIPIQNALGTIQRSKQILIAGDENQMGPTSYFKKGQSDVLDLLHQANYNYTKVSLQHHYRSSHPDLIAFSNKHFYNGDLKVYPSFKNSTPINHHYLSDGIFEDRKNEVEAKAIARKIETLISQKGSIGIVAFSEEQLNCIWNHFSKKAQQNISERLDSNNGFFKSLENVQGDECDHLIIGFGYGKNEVGEFQMRFGPMNTANGRKRLNVLLTRAIESIDFFCSIESSHFKLSDNESINLLRQWISFSEGYLTTENSSFPFELKPIINKNELIFNKIQEKLPQAREVVTLHRVLSTRGWKVSYA